MAVFGKQPGKQPRDTGKGWQNNTNFFAEFVWSWLEFSTQQRENICSC